MKSRLLLLIVAYHPSKDEVENILSCLNLLQSNVNYALVVNDYHGTEPADKLAKGAKYVIRNSDNPGYGVAINRLFKSIPNPPDFVGFLNTDLTWKVGTFETMLDWIAINHDVNLLAPLILDRSNYIQKLCKQNPTFLGLLSRRFIPHWLKPRFLLNYDKWYTMNAFDYNSIFDVPYLSGCCMVARSSSFIDCGGFDERYFLYLEDADLTRMLSQTGRCIHFPYSSVVHSWGRANHHKLSLTIVNIVSAFKYFTKWGLSLW